MEVSILLICLQRFSPLSGGAEKRAFILQDCNSPRPRGRPTTNKLISLFGLHQTVSLLLPNFHIHPAFPYPNQAKRRSLMLRKRHQMPTLINLHGAKIGLLSNCIVLCPLNHKRRIPRISKLSRMGIVYLQTHSFSTEPVAGVIRIVARRGGGRAR